MVFESLLSDLLNRFLKPYVKKIDSSNLNIGVWNGRYRYSVCYKSNFFGYISSLAMNDSLGNVNLKQLELKEDILVSRSYITRMCGFTGGAGGLDPRDKIQDPVIMGCP